MAFAVLSAACPSVSAEAAHAPCPDPLAVLRAFYDDNDALRFKDSAELLTDDARFATWATGANGHIVAERHLKGKDQIASYLPAGRGLGRLYNPFTIEAVLEGCKIRSLTVIEQVTWL
jgi:hypothetical protein